MAKKYYAVKVGLNTGIFKTWDECKKQITGFSGAIYKSFPTLEQAEEYLDNENIEIKSKNFEFEVTNDDEVMAYVDGSYRKDTLEYGYGIVLILKDDIIELYGKGKDTNFSKSMNVAGELFGAINAIKEAIKLGKKKIIIFHDYQGIAAWANGDWKCNLPLTVEYRDKIKEFRKEIEISFVKVKAHSNNKYNDLSDYLAKKSLGIN